MLSLWPCLLLTSTLADSLPQNHLVGLNVILLAFSVIDEHFSRLSAAKSIILCTHELWFELFEKSFGTCIQKSYFMSAVRTISGFRILLWDVE